MKVRVGVGMGATALGDGAGFSRLVDDIDGLGFDSIWLPEVLTAPTLDPLAALAFAAARNSHLKLGTTVVLPGRNLVRAAKQLSTLDLLSGGRLLITFVPGIPRQPESGAVGVAGPDKGRMMDETLPVLRRLWAGERVTHHGAFADFEEVAVAPRPIQRPLEFWTGGMVPAALRRCGRFADGWLPSSCTPEEVAAARLVIDEAAEQAGRVISPEHFGVSLAYARRPLEPKMIRALAAARKGVDPEQLVPVGLDRLRSLIERFLEVGFSKFVVRPLESPGSWRAELEALASAVLDLQT
ncbi:MAG: LLM class flavin-dependent oxidoreductase [Acidimicrobiales bacterium]